MKGQVRNATTFRPVGISEFKVYADITTAPQPSNNATLTSLQLNGEEIEGFDPSTYSYTYVLGYNDEIPEITAIPATNASAFVVPLHERWFRVYYCICRRWYNEPLYHPVPTQRRNVGPCSAFRRKTELVENELVPFTLTATMEDGTELTSGSYTVAYKVTATDDRTEGLGQIQ